MGASPQKMTILERSSTNFTEGVLLQSFPVSNGMNNVGPQRGFNYLYHGKLGNKTSSGGGSPNAKIAMKT